MRRGGSGVGFVLHIRLAREVWGDLGNCGEGRHRASPLGGARDRRWSFSAPRRRWREAVLGTRDRLSDASPPSVSPRLCERGSYVSGWGKFAQNRIWKCLDRPCLSVATSRASTFDAASS